MSDTIRINGFFNDSLVDGPGLRFVVFTQGCPFACPGCHNPNTWDAKGGHEVEISDIQAMWRKNKMLDGITLSGGEPLFQKKAILEIVKLAASDKLNITLYSGDTYENLLKRNNPIINEILTYVDYLIDGPFVLAKKDLTLLYRGSSNQRIIALKKTREVNSLVLINNLNEF